MKTQCSTDQLIFCFWTPWTLRNTENSCGSPQHTGRSNGRPQLAWAYPLVVFNIQLPLGHDNRKALQLEKPANVPVKSKMGKRGTWGLNTVRLCSECQKRWIWIWALPQTNLVTMAKRWACCSNLKGIEDKNINYYSDNKPPTSKLELSFSLWIDWWLFCFDLSLIQKETKYYTNLHCTLLLFRSETQSVLLTRKAANSYPPCPIHMQPHPWLWTGGWGQ